MANTSSINFVLLNQAINRYVPVPLLFLGIIGNILNILIFVRHIFRNNICAIFFLMSTVFDSFVIFVGLLPRLLNGFGVDPTQYSGILCKLRFFITYYAGYTAAWFISLACVERYLRSSRNIHKREMMSKKRAYVSILCVLLFGILVFGEQFYCIDIHQNLFGAPQSCYQLKQNISCQVVDSLMQCLFEILAPTFMMIIFGLLTVRNIRRSRHRVHVVHSNAPPLSTRTNRLIQKRDVQLVPMLLVQVTVFAVSAFPISIYKIYCIVTIYNAKSVLQMSIENTIFNVCVLSLFLNNTITFYLYTLSGRVFRKELMKLLHLS
ncbi:unnamed protein product [Adineta ricciae]|uniref:G-protein coupled receptors family 1 profile domain-containing protein n=1 Tax=Adineta ricciae TaxID=249248 RepID=A0A815U592_ADIRI|nr:unnamed protein product [Adineta ricciae]